MASESTTKPFVVDRGTSGGKSFYNVDVTTLANSGAAIVTGKQYFFLI